MSERFTQDDVIATITRLTHVQLVSYIEAAFIQPEQSDGGYLFRQVDIARLELLCDLSQDLGLDENALVVVISLIDQLHIARQERAAITRAIHTLPADLGNRILAAVSEL